MPSLKRKFPACFSFYEVPTKVLKVLVMAGMGVSLDSHAASLGGAMALVPTVSIAKQDHAHQGYTQKKQVRTRRKTALLPCLQNKCNVRSRGRGRGERETHLELLAEGLYANPEVGAGVHGENDVEEMSTAEARRPKRIEEARLARRAWDATSDGKTKTSDDKTKTEAACQLNGA